MKWLGLVACLSIYVMGSAAAAADPVAVAQSHVSLSTAEALIKAGQDQARAKGINLVFVVVDANGNPVGVSRMDGVSPLLTDVARRKAITALMMQRPSGEVAEPPSLATIRLMGIDDVLPVRGGIPIRLNGKLIGAMGASGAPAEQDEAAVLAAITAVIPAN